MTYGYLPLWVLNNILTLGTISKFYSLMKQNERQTVSKIFRLSDNELESILTYVSSVRNFRAHMVTDYFVIEASVHFVTPDFIHRWVLREI